MGGAVFLNPLAAGITMPNNHNLVKIMEVKKIGIFFVELELNDEELLALRRTLNEVCNGIQVADNDDQFLLKLTVSRVTLDGYMDKLVRSKDNIARRNIADRELKMTQVLSFRKVELVAMYNSLTIVCHSKDIGEYEFAIRLGVTRIDLLGLAHKFQTVISGLG
jgi:hypothetical protein